MSSTNEAIFNKIHFKGHDLYLLRDDLIGGDFNGNKARKLEYFLKADLSAFSTVCSYGSSQSNAMAALSIFAKRKKLDFIYFTNHISEFLRANPTSNYSQALANGAKIIARDDYKEHFKALKNASAHAKTTLFIPEGIACKQAEIGFKTQASEIFSFMLKNKITFDIFLPSGSGTAAAYLAKNLSECAVYTTPCVGGVEYLKEQIFSLDLNSKVRILEPALKCYFGDLKREFYDIWQELKEQCGIDFELIYDPLGWLTLLANLKTFKNPILYIHQGGLGGLSSQLARYERKF